MEIMMSVVRLACAVPAALIVAVSAIALTYQPAPRNSDGTTRLIDPDEQAERLVETTTPARVESFRSPD